MAGLVSYNVLAELDTEIFLNYVIFANCTFRPLFIVITILSQENLKKILLPSIRNQVEPAAKYASQKSIKTSFVLGNMSRAHTLMAGFLIGIMRSAFFPRRRFNCCISATSTMRFLKLFYETRPLCPPLPKLLGLWTCNFLTRKILRIIFQVQRLLLLLVGLKLRRNLGTSSVNMPRATVRNANCVTKSSKLARFAWVQWRCFISNGFNFSIFFC